MKLIYVVEDEEVIRHLMVRYLEKEGFSVRGFASGEELMCHWREKRPDMVILDIMLPGVDGLALCRSIRQEAQTPIIFVSAKGDEVDRVVGLELGADDYLTKPFSPREMVARVKNIFRRLGAAAAESPALHVGDLRLDASARAVWASEQSLELTSKEYELLRVLCQHAGKACSREKLLDAVWGVDYVGDTRAVDDLVKRVRRKMRDAGSQAEIETIWGYGYRIDG